VKAVVDSNVGIKCVLPEPDSAKAVALLTGYAQQIHELIAPDVYAIECAHALARAERKGLMAPPQGSLDLQRLLRVLPAPHPSIPLLPRAFELASQARIGVYDCLYIALAEHEQCDFITADVRLVNSGVYARTIELTSLP
jgi:predicted nucleic acid-binding protein